ncbi:glucose-1-phosphate thymidylyltransferase, partial [Streptomyces sp. SID11233]|nr:glucose-1-phosphate thymidylyltransferase [Streptomyces sp. SID11233]
MECNRELLSRLETTVEGEVDEETTIEGSVVIAADAKVSRSQLRGPLVIGSGSVVSDSIIGPDVSVG